MYPWPAPYSSFEHMWPPVILTPGTPGHRLAERPTCVGAHHAEDDVRQRLESQPRARLEPALTSRDGLVRPMTGPGGEVRQWPSVSPGAALSALPWACWASRHGGPPFFRRRRCL